MKIRNIYIASFLLIGIISCSKSFLDVEPIDRYVVSNFVQNQGQVEQAVVACYRKVFAIANNYIWIYGDFLSDNTSYYRNPTDRGGVATEEVDEFMAEARNTTFNGVYQESFEGVTRSNYVLGNIENITFTSDSLKNLRKAEAQFFRAWHYFNLVRLFGDVPLVTQVITDSRESYKLKRDPADQIYPQIIIPDAQFAVEKLPTKVPASQTGRLTKGAALMLLSKIYMTQKRFAEAKPLLEEVTRLGYALNANYVDNFNPSKKNSPESIYEIQAGDITSAFGLMGQWAPWGSARTVWGAGANSRGGLNQPTEDLIKAYETADSLRSKVVVGIYKAGTVDVPYMNKFNYYDAALNANAINYPIYRYADALLMLAECQNETNETDKAIANLNLIRTRAKIPSKTRGNANPVYAVNSQADMRTAIEKERQIELAGEGRRWFDLVRTGRAEQVMKEHGAREKANELKKTYLLPEAFIKIRILLPMPDREIREFGFSQTPEW